MSKVIDLTGRQFGRLTVIGDTGERRNYKAVWHCRCTCGREVDTLSASLQNGKTRSCGCLRKEELSKMSIVDLTGQRFGSLTVMNITNRRSGDKVMWHCRCDCGRELDVADVIAAQVDVHQARDRLGRIGVTVVMNALDERAGAVADADDRDANLVVLVARGAVR